MARTASRRSTRYEGSAEDEAEDARGAKRLGVSKAAYERTAKDRAEDAAGQSKLRTRVKQALAKR